MRIRLKPHWDEVEQMRLVKSNWQSFMWIQSGLLRTTIQFPIRRLATRPPGEMASRLTTNQEIAGSIPAVVIHIFALFLHPGTEASEEPLQ